MIETLYAERRVKICGFVMGRYGDADRDQDAGVSLVGMFDTEENRRRVPQEPSTPGLNAP